ncbi:MAG TPA: toast rack family protein [Anaerolineales bacterium]|nr:toast rack family protein [Anaerolineales bacterium]
MIGKGLLRTLVFSGLLLAGCAAELRVGELQTESRSVAPQHAESIRVEIELGAGDLEVSAGADELLEADFAYNVAALRPEVEFSNRTLSVRQPGAKGLPVLQDVGSFQNAWDLRLSDAVQMDLLVDVGAGEIDLQLAGLSLTTLGLGLGAGEGTVDLTGEWTRDVDVTVDVGAANIRLLLPEKTGVRVETEVGPTLITTSGLMKDGKIYTNGAYGVSDVTLYISIDAGIGQVRLDVVEAGARSAH